MRTIHIVDTPRDADRISLIRRRLGPSTLSVHQQYPGSGTFEGCLDDTGVDTTMPWIVHPPSIRGSLRMNSP